MSDPSSDGETAVEEEQQHSVASVQEETKESESTVTDVLPTEEDETPAAGEAKISNLEAPALPAPKPLRSILKKRKPEEPAVEASTDESTKEPVIKKPKAGSITEALKMVTGAVGDKEEDKTEPKPSAFILEMEKQKDILPDPSAPVPGTLSLLNRLEGATVGNAVLGWQNPQVFSQPEPVSFFQQEQMRQQMMKAKKKAMPKSAPPPTVSHPPVITPTAVDLGPKTMLTPHETLIEGILMISNLPYQVTVPELIKFLGIWPKGGHRGIKLITDSAGLPSGLAYVIVERHSDLMEVIRLTGFEMQGRKIKCLKVKRKNIIDDWKVTKKALALTDKSRIVKMSHLPFFLTKTELIITIDEVTFTEDDIYWSPLKEGQTNSGRGFIVCKSSEDAKKVAKEKSYAAKGRSFEVSQVHPVTLERFCLQCKMTINKDHVLTDEVDDSWDNIDDLDLDPNGGPEDQYVAKSDMDSPSVASPSSAEGKIVERDTSFQKSQKFRREREMERGLPPPHHRALHFRPPGHGGPPFSPTVFVRMHNVPDKSTTEDIRRFFEPFLPAKIAQNVGYDIYDIEFYTPDEAMQSMRRHRLMLRKNIISLEMLPGPPTPLPPRKSFTCPPVPLPLGIMPPRMEPVPPGVVSPNIGPMPCGIMPSSIGPPRHGMMPGHPGIPSGPLPHGMTPPMRMVPAPPGMFMKPMMMGMPIPFGPPQPTRSGPMPISNLEVIDPKMMPPPMKKAGPKKSRHKKSASPTPVLEPKKELIPVPPLPGNFATYVLPPFKNETPIGQGVITTMQGFFCQLCNKFYSSRASAKDVHCKTKGHYDKLKQFLREKKRLRKLAEVDALKK